VFDPIAYFLIETEEFVSIKVKVVNCGLSEGIQEGRVF
jgi:hypothetical protein